MISFRFHLVSLVAVFLALGLGVLTGTTVLNRGIVEQLETTTDRLAAQSSELRSEVERLETELAGWWAFGGDVRDFLIDDRLVGDDAVLVTQEGTDQVAVESTRRALEMAGARLRLEVALDLRLALDAEGDAEALARLLGVDPAEDVESLRAQVAEQLADQIAFGPRGTDLLDVLARAGFVAVERPEPVPPDRAAPVDPLIVVVGGSAVAPPLPADALLVPLVERLVLDGQTVAAAEALATEDPFVEVLRNGDVADRLVTQDNVDDVPGEVSLVLAAEDLVELGEPGHYGVKPGAGRRLPPLE